MKRTYLITASLLLAGSLLPAQSPAPTPRAPAPPLPPVRQSPEVFETEEIIELIETPENAEAIARLRAEIEAQAARVRAEADELRAQADAMRGQVRWEGQELRTMGLLPGDAPGVRVFSFPGDGDMAGSAEGFRLQTAPRAPGAPTAPFFAILRESLDADMEKFLAEELPEALEEVERARAAVEEAANKLEARREVEACEQDAVRLVRELQEVSRQTPEAYEAVLEERRLGIEQERLVKEFRQAEDEGRRSELKAELAGVLEKNFEVSQRVRRLEADKIEEELSRVHELLAKREDNRQIIIERRMKELLEEDDPYAW